jgi:hypothetical protein
MSGAAARSSARFASVMAEDWMAANWMTERRLLMMSTVRSEGSLLAYE